MGDMIEFQANGQKCKGYLAKPDSGKGPGVVVLQEWWGLVDHIKDVCDRFAKEGFVALAPDLYHGETTTSPDEAGKLMMALNIGRTEKDMRGAVQHLLDLEETQGNRVGSVGFCMGGQLSLYAACANPQQIGACVIFYGIHPEVNPRIENLQAPVLGFFGRDDEMVKPEAVNKLEARLKKEDKTVEFHIYDGCGHAFFNDTRPDTYNEEAAKGAWEKMLAFYREQLG